MKACLYKMFDEPPRSVNFQRRPVFDPSQRKIPLTLMQTWESNLFGKRHAASLERLIALNPEIAFRFYCSEARDQYIMENADDELKALYFASIYTPMRVDIFRYLHTLLEGGYYLDISMGLSAPLTALTSGSDTGMIAFEKNKSVFHAPPASFSHVRYPLNLVCIWGFGFEPGHPILIHALNYIRERYSSFNGYSCEPPKDAIISLTGPAALTQGVWKYLEKEDPFLRQHDFDFGDFGFRHNGAGYRHRQHPSYARVAKGQILGSPKGAN